MSNASKTRSTSRVVSSCSSVTCCAQVLANSTYLNIALRSLFSSMHITACKLTLYENSCCSCDATSCKIYATYTHVTSSTQPIKNSRDLISCSLFLFRQEQATALTQTVTVDGNMSTCDGEQEPYIWVSSAYKCGDNPLLLTSAIRWAV